MAPALISTVRLDERRRPGGINVRRPLAGTRTSRPPKNAKNVETPGRHLWRPACPVVHAVKGAMNRAPTRSVGLRA